MAKRLKSFGDYKTDGNVWLGFECAGVKTIGYEMKPECCETYRANLHSECRNEMLTEETP